jgi:hypothetical protein
MINTVSRSKKNWIESARPKPNALRRTLRANSVENIPESRLGKVLHSKNKLTAKRAKLAKTINKFC